MAVRERGKEMRSDRLVLLVLMAALIVITASDLYAQGVRFLSLQDGDTVRDAVLVQATKPDPASGWISYKIEKGGGGDFMVAAVEPFAFLWDTRERDENGKDLYPDGQYTITASALSSQAKKVGEATITVTVKNAIGAGDRPSDARLRLNYERNQQVRYQAYGSWELRPAPDEENPDDVWELAKEANGAVVANWRNKVMSPTVAGGRAVLHVIVGSSGQQIGTEEEVTALPGAGKSHTYVALQDGTMRKKHEDEDSFDLAELYMQLPDRELRVGDTWTSEMRVLPVPQMDTEVRVVRAKHRVEGFEWVMGHECLRIASDYKVDNEKIKLRLQPQATQAPIFGEEGAGDFPGAMAEEPAMMGAEMGMEGEMGMGAGQAQPEIETSYVGQRTTYFAYDVNRPVRIVDSITHTLEVPRGVRGVGEGGLMPGEAMPGFEEMPMAEEAGMAEPGFAGGPGFAGEPGGFGQMQTQPAEPMKVKVNVRLTIAEVGR
jgi:hypothetical protein